MSNLRLINETEVSTSVNSVIVDNLFTADFDIYKIVSTVQINSTTNFSPYWRFVNSAGSIVSSSNYDVAKLEVRSYDAFLERPVTRTNQSNLYVFTQFANDEGGASTHYIFNPYSSSSYTFCISQSFGSAGTSGGIGDKGIGVLKQTNQITGINVYNPSTSDNFSSGFIRTYGLRVDS